LALKRSVKVFIIKNNFSLTHLLDDNIIMLEVGVYISKTVAFVYEIKTLPNVSFNL